MKKRLLFVIASLVGVSTMSYAQFKINQNGNISVQSTTTPLSVISVNGEGEDNTTFYYKGPRYTIHGVTVGGNYNWGNAAEFSSKVGTYNFSVGVKAMATPVDLVEVGSRRAFGVYGSAGFATSGWNYGIYGSLAGTSNGAGVYGTSNSVENGIPLGKRYAGYFHGDVGISGKLTVNGTIDGVVLGASASTLSAAQALDLDVASESVSDKLSGFSAVPFYKPVPLSTCAIEGDTVSQERMITNMEIQDMSKVHYALSAEQLEERYPELVYDNEDGSKGINYIEMIPLLVQSIGELNAKIARLESENGNLKKAAKANNVTGIDGAVVAGIALLAQNEPNPFDYSTSIKMNIPAEAKNAVLCIYDLNGKQLKQMVVAERGETVVSVTNEGLCAGMYLYSLIVDGNLVKTRRMIVAS